MIASSITPPPKEEGPEVDGIEGAGESVVSIRGHFSRSRASLHRTDRANGNHDREVRRLWNRDRKIANDPRDSRRKNKLITGHRIPIDINDSNDEVRNRVYNEVL